MKGKFSKNIKKSSSMKPEGGVKLKFGTHAVGH